MRSKVDGKFVTAKMSRADAVDSECTGKSAFKTFRQARTSARRLAAREKEPYAPYRCSECGAFHVGSSLKPQEKRPRFDDDEDYMWDEGGIVIGSAGKLKNNAST